MTDDAELLRQYARANSHEAFAELVERRVDLVYAVALRRVGGNPHSAEEVTQQVFTDLARNARKLSSHPVLEAWLFKSTHFASAKWVRSEQRRRQRETEAHAMNPLLPDDAAGRHADQTRPLIDDVLLELDDRDRDAVILRFFSGLGFGELGSRLQLTEDGARSRVTRALEKLQSHLARRGITSTSAALATALGTQAASKAPAGLVAAISQSALTLAVSNTAATTLTLLALSKIKITICAAAIAACGSVMIVQERTVDHLREEVKSLQRAGVEAIAPASHAATISNDPPDVPPASLPPTVAQPSAIANSSPQPGLQSTRSGPGFFAFQPGPRPSAEEMARLRQENVVRQVAQITENFEPFYERLGVSTPEQQSQLTRLKIIQVQNTESAVRAVLAAHPMAVSPTDRDARDTAAQAARERVRAEFIDHVRATLGDDTAKAMELFEAAQTAVYKKMVTAGFSEPTAEAP